MQQRFVCLDRKLSKCFQHEEVCAAREHQKGGGTFILGRFQDMARPCHSSPEPRLAPIPFQVGGWAGDPPPSAPSLYRKGSSLMKRARGKDPAAQDISIWLKQFSIEVFIE